MIEIQQWCPCCETTSTLLLTHEDAQGLAGEIQAQLTGLPFTQLPPGWHYATQPTETS